MRTLAIIPAFNEHQQLPAVVDQTLHFVEHVLIVDDGSSQTLGGSLAANPRVSLLRHPVNLGKGAAMKTGAEWAVHHGFETAVFLDADGQHNPNEIPALLAPIENNQADIAFGVRKFHAHMPLVARLGNHFLSLALRILFRIDVGDTQSGFRALRLSRFPELVWESPRYAVETEMIVNVAKHQIPYAQIPISTIYLDRYKGTTILDGIRIFLNMLSWRIQ